MAGAANRSAKLDDPLSQSSSHVAQNDSEAESKEKKNIYKEKNKKTLSEVAIHKESDKKSTLEDTKSGDALRKKLQAKLRELEKNGPSLLHSSSDEKGSFIESMIENSLESGNVTQNGISLLKPDSGTAPDARLTASDGLNTQGTLQTDNGQQESFSLATESSLFERVHHKHRAFSNSFPIQ